MKFNLFLRQKKFLRLLFRINLGINFFGVNIEKTFIFCYYQQYFSTWQFSLIVYLKKQHNTCLHNTCFLININNTTCLSLIQSSIFIFYFVCVCTQRILYGSFRITSRINPRHHYHPESFSSRDDIGRGLIRDVIRKEPYHIMFIIYLNMRKSCSVL